MYIETSGYDFGDIVFDSFERTEFIQISNETFYYISFPTSYTNKRGMGRFGIQLLLSEDIWSTRYKIPKSGRYTLSATQWTLVSLNSNIDDYGLNWFMIK